MSALCIVKWKKPRKQSKGKSILTWLVMFVTLFAFGLALTVYGWPKTLSGAGSFASFTAAEMTPASLILLVLSLSEQEKTWRRAMDDNFRAVQVRSPIALIEDDRHKLAGMSNADKKGTKMFNAVLARNKKRVKKLNHMLKDELQLSDLEGDGELEQ
jgi:hypothetical protein